VPDTDQGAVLHGDGLTERQERILQFEQQWWRRAGAKDQAIRDQFGTTPWRYYAELARIIRLPAALAAHPALVARLTRAAAGS
jgi:hypothetical protein